MNQKILPNEVYVVEHGALIKTRCPKEDIDLHMIHQRVIAANLSAGDTIRVQCMNHERTTVLCFAEFMVYDRSTEIKKVEISDRETRTMEDVKYSVIQTRDWQSTPAGLAQAVQVTAQPEKTSEDISAPKVVWNPKKRVHQVKEGNKVLYESKDKEDAQHHAEAAIA